MLKTSLETTFWEHENEVLKRVNEYGGRFLVQSQMEGNNKNLRGNLKSTQEILFPQYKVLIKIISSKMIFFKVKSSRDMIFNFKK